MSENGKRAKRELEVVHKHVLEKLNPDEDKEDVEKLKDELKETKEKLGERETQLGAIAMKRYEEEKDELSKALTRQYGKSKADKIMGQITDPLSLEVAKGLLEEDDEDLEQGSPSIYKGGSRLDETGGSVPEYAPSKSGTFKSGRDVINALYDAYEEEKFKQETGKEYNAERLGKLEKQLDILWSHVKKGIEARRGNILGERSRGLGTVCRHCGAVTFERICENCGHETMSKSEWEERGR